MTGWMFLFMGIFNYTMNDKDMAMTQLMIGLPLILVSFYLIRNQTFINQQQYLTGMIPHHSMATHMSRKLLENYDSRLDPRVCHLAQNIIKTQTQEIDLMKDLIRH